MGRKLWYNIRVKQSRTDSFSPYRFSAYGTYSFFLAVFVCNGVGSTPFFVFIGGADYSKGTVDQRADQG